MAVLNAIVHFMSTYIFNQPFILLGLVAMLGLVVQRNPSRMSLPVPLKLALGT